MDYTEQARNIVENHEYIKSRFAKNDVRFIYFNGMNRLSWEGDMDEDPDEMLAEVERIILFGRRMNLGLLYNQ